MATFERYAGYYDLLNKGKSYFAECGFVLELLALGGTHGCSILELGCGTGGHAVEFGRMGHRVLGVDLSGRMTRIAEERRVSSGLDDRAVSFMVGDIRSIRTGRKFDAVLSLFHVISYQASNSDLMSTFGTARAHLEPGGGFVFDFWYGPAVLSDRPRNVERRVADEQLEIERSTTPEMRVNTNCVRVHFDIRVRRKSDEVVVEFSEDHVMRYLFLPELRLMLERSGFELSRTVAWMSGEEPDDTTWYACVLARAV